MCCLKFENDDYETAKAELPDLGESIMTPQGSGKVVGINILDGVVQVELFELERVVEYTIGELLEQGTMSF